MFVVHEAERSLVQRTHVGESTFNKTIIESENVLFVGAGASAPLGLQPTAPFLEHLTEKLNSLIAEREQKSKGNGWAAEFKLLYDQSARHHMVSTADCETVLDYLDYLIDASHKLDTLATPFGDLAATSGASGFHRNWYEMLGRIKSYIQEIVVRHYSTVDGSQALSLWEPVIGTIAPSKQILPIFTTNYDWVFEEMAQVSGGKLQLEDGFRLRPKGAYWSSESFELFVPSSDGVSLVLFKLHGSTSWTSWYEGPNSSTITKVARLAPLFAGSTPMLIYPTQVKSDAIQREPFRTAYQYFDQTLAHAQLCLVIGFSFRDPAINLIFRKAFAANRKLKMMIIDPNIGEPSGVELSYLRKELEDLDDGMVNTRIKGVKGKFGEKFAYGQIEAIMRNIAKWDQLEPLAVPSSRP